MIAQERVNLLTEILDADPERATKLLGLDVSEALLQLNALGCKFTVNELKEYAALIREAQKNAQDDELSLDDLDEAAGGSGSVSFGKVSIAGISIGKIVIAWS